MLGTAAASRAAYGVTVGDERLGDVTDLIDTTEMYLRTIFELEEEGIPPLRARIAERLGHSGPTVSQTVARMERDGLLTVAGDRHLELSELGRALATRVMRKHRLAERLLHDVIGLEWEYVHDEACRWEHVMSERVERKILALVGDLAESPYGNPIPGLAELGEVGVQGAWVRGERVTGEFATGEFPRGEFAPGTPPSGEPPLGEPPAGGAPTVGAGAPVALTEVAVVEPTQVRVRRIGEPVQVDREALALLTAAGLLPGQPALVRLDGSRTIAVRLGEDESTGVSLPGDVAGHVFVERL